MVTLDSDNLSLLLDQHYFYFVLLRSKGAYSLGKYWSQLGSGPFTIDESEPFERRYSDFEIQRCRLLSDEEFTRGELLRKLSATKDGRRPYQYDLLGLRILSGPEIYFVLAYPFASLASRVIRSLIRPGGLLKECDVLKVSVPTVLRSGEILGTAEDIHSHVVGVQMVIASDPVLSSLKLGGDNPLKSDFYLSYLQDLIVGGKFKPDQCVLACEVLKTVSGQVAPEPRTLRARVRIDLFGNFRFYVHLDGKNFFVIPRLIQQLSSIDCFETASTNPLDRLVEEESD